MAQRPGSRTTVGRDQELLDVSARLDDAVAGRGSLLLLAGEPGLGKSHLLDELARLATARGVTVAFAACWEGEGATPLRLWAQVVDELSDAGHVSDQDLPVLLGERTPANGLLGEIDPVGTRLRLFDRVVTCLRRVAAEEPLVIVLDDLHWADRSSLELLSQLSASSHSSHLMVAGAYRDTEIDDALGAFLQALPSDVTRVTLSGLPPSDVAELARSVSGAAVDDELVSTLARHTAGNPFFVKELVRLLVAQDRLSESTGMPAGVREMLSRRLARLSTSCRTTLGVAAVIGGEFDAKLVGAAVDGQREEVADALDEAVGARVVVEAGLNRFRFVHDLFRQALYEGLGRTRRLRLHLGVGEAIEARHACDLDPHLGELAHHFLTAAPVGDAAKAAGYGWKAGRRAAAMLAFDEAVAYLERALEADPSAPTLERARLLIALGEARWRARDIAGARAALTEAADLARANDAADVFAEAALAYGGGRGGNQPLASADVGLVALLDEALQQLPEDDSVLRCRLLSRLAVELYLTDAQERRVELSAEALALARRLDDASSLAGALYARQVAIFGPDGVEERQAAADEILHLAEEAGDLELALWGHLFRAWAWAQQCVPVDKELAVCAQLADRLGLAALRAEVATRQAVNALVAGEFSEAERLMEVVEAGEATDLAVGASKTALLALTAALKGPYEELAELVSAVLVEQPDKVMWRTGLVVVFVELGCFDDARREFDVVAASGFDLPRDGLWLNGMFNLGFACFALEIGEHADELHRVVVQHVDQAPVGAFGSMATPVGLLDAARGRFDEALSWLEIGYRRNLAVNNRAYAAFTRRETAAVLLARGEPDDREVARRILGDVIIDLRASGFDGLVGRADSLLAAATVDDSALPNELRRDGTSWVATFGGSTVHLKGSKGIEDLAVLLAQPNREVAAVDLCGALVAGDTGDVLDERARREVRARLVDLEQDVTEAEELGDRGRAEQARLERDALAANLTAAFGLGGRARRSGDVRERARKTVTWRIRQAIRTVTNVHPTLGEHLDRSVRTGTFCVYAPEHPTRWQVATSSRQEVS